MTPEQVTDIVRQALAVAMEVSSPLLILAMVVGLTISIFQSVTQINEMTLTFVPKMFIFAFALILFFPWILKTMTTYTLNVLVYQWEQLVTLSNYTS